MRASVAPLLAALWLALPALGHAAPVLVMSSSGHVTARQDPFVPPTAGSTPLPTLATASSASPPHVPAPKKPRKPQKTVRSELSRLLKAGAITPTQYGAYSASFNAALTAERHLSGTRATELEAVTKNLHAIAVAGKLTPGRLPVLFQTLDYNRQWWTTGPLPSANQYVEFAGSQLVWEYYPGQGIELQVLATFGKADGLYTAGPGDYPQMQELLGARNTRGP
jgi:hypothetical protein